MLRPRRGSAESNCVGERLTLILGVRVTTNDFDAVGLSGDSSSGSDASDQEVPEVPFHLETLPDGHEAVVIGDVDRLKEFNHRQGDNDLGFKGTCGIVSCQDVLRQFGVEATEGELVKYAALRGLCNSDGTADDRGGTTVLAQAQILNDWGVAATADVGGSLDGLAARIEEGRGVIIEVNAGVLWDDARYYDDGGVNHAVVVTGLARDAATGAVHGFYINDSGVPSSGRFVDADTMRTAWVEAGGLSVSTLPVHRDQWALSAVEPPVNGSYDRWGVGH